MKLFKPQLHTNALKTREGNSFDVNRLELSSLLRFITATSIHAFFLPSFRLQSVIDCSGEGKSNFSKTSRHIRKRHCYLVFRCTFISQLSSTFLHFHFNSFFPIASSMNLFSVSHSKDIYFLELKKNRCIILFVLSCSCNVLKKSQEEEKEDALSVLCFSVSVFGFCLLQTCRCYFCSFL